MPAPKPRAERRHDYREAPLSWVLAWVLGLSITRRSSSGNPAIDWFEVISENYMIEGGQPLYMLDRIRERYPIVMHGVSLSIASTAPFDMDYLRALKGLAAARSAEMDLRSPLLDRRPWGEPARSPAHPLHPRGARPRRRPRQLRAGFPRQAFHHRERVDLRHLRPIGDDRVGIRERACATHRLLAPVRRQQRLCQRLQSRLLRHRFSARHAARPRRPVPCGRAQPRGDPHHRHPRPPGVRRGVGLLSRGGRAISARSRP